MTVCSAHSLYSYTDCTRYNLTTLLSPLPRLVTVESVNITLFSCQAINLPGFFFFTFCSVRRRHTSIFISIMETGPSLCLRQDDRRLNLCQVSNIIMMYTICLMSMTLKPVVSWYCLWLELRRLGKTESEKVMKGLIYQYRETNKVQFDLNVFFLWHSNWFCARV